MILSGLVGIHILGYKVCHKFLFLFPRKNYQAHTMNGTHYIQGFQRILVKKSMLVFTLLLILILLISKHDCIRILVSFSVTYRNLMNFHQWCTSHLDCKLQLCFHFDIRLHIACHHNLMNKWNCDYFNYIRYLLDIIEMFYILIDNLIIITTGY